MEYGPKMGVCAGCRVGKSQAVVKNAEARYLVGMMAVVGILFALGLLPIALLFIDRRRHPRQAVVFVVLFITTVLLIHPLLKFFGFLLPMVIPLLLAAYVLMALKQRR